MFANEEGKLISSLMVSEILNKYKLIEDISELDIENVSFEEFLSCKIR